jgi:SH3-like domain-containing protein
MLNDTRSAPGRSSKQTLLCCWLDFGSAFWGALILASFMILPTVCCADVEPVCVSKANVTLRRGPGEKYAATWTVPKYMPFLQIDKKGKWVKVRDLDGESHWVRRDKVSQRMSCLVVKARVAHLRKGPGSQEPIADLSTVDKYTPFRKLDRDGEWLKVRDDVAGVYWIHEDSVWIPMVHSRVEFN